MARERREGGGGAITHQNVFVRALPRQKFLVEGAQGGHHGQAAILELLQLIKGGESGWLREWLE